MVQEVLDQRNRQARELPAARPAPVGVGKVVTGSVSGSAFLGVTVDQLASMSN
jgi:hypothetical protein